MKTNLIRVALVISVCFGILVANQPSMQSIKTSIENDRGDATNFINIPSRDYNTNRLNLAGDYNGVNSFSEVWSATNILDGDVFWGVSGPYDLDGDGNQELLAYTDFNGITLHLFENTGDNSWTEKWTYNITNVMYSYEAADQTVDLDGDGLPEILVGGKGGLSGDYDGLFVFELDTTANDVALTQVASF